MIIWLFVLAADLSGTWVGSGAHGGPMCLALSQNEREISGNMAYEEDRKFAAISEGKVDGQQVSFEVEDLDHGKMRFRFRADGEKLIAEDGAVLTKWVPARNRQFDAGLPAPPRILHSEPLKISEEALKEHIPGTVKLGIEILTNGEVGPDVKVYNSVSKIVDQLAIEMVKKWKFTPPREDCQFMTKRTTIEVSARF